MRETLALIGVTVFVVLPGAVAAQEFPPSCNMCSATYVDVMIEQCDGAVLDA